MAKVMLVEDDTNLSEIYQARMAAEGYEIVTAHDGEEALATAAKEKPDLIISDVMMPKISGFEMLDILRNTEGLKDTKVIMLTALGQADDKTRAEGLGADRYLVKSQVTLEDIVKAAHELLGIGEASAIPAPAAATPNTPPQAPDPNPTPQPPAAPTPHPVLPAVPVPPVPTSPTPATPATPTVTRIPVTPAPTVPAPIATPKPTPTPTPTASPRPVATPTPQPPAAPQEPPSAPLLTKPPQPVPAPAVPANSAAAVDQQLVSNAAAALQAATPAAPATRTPVSIAQTTTPPLPQPEAEETADTSNGTITHKKIIKPLDDDAGANAKPSLQALLAAEESKNPANLSQQSTNNGLPHQPGNVVAPTQPTDNSQTTSGALDPNSVAL